MREICGVVQILFMNSTRIEPPLASTLESTIIFVAGLSC